MDELKRAAVELEGLEKALAAKDRDSIMRMLTSATNALGGKDHFANDHFSGKEVRV